MIALQFLAGIAATLAVLAALAWWASKDAARLQSPHDPVKLQAEREAVSSMCDADTDYDWLETGPDRLTLEEEAERKAIVAAAQWGVL